MKRAKRAIGLTLAALTAASCSVCAFADTAAADEELKTVLTTVKSRINIPEELTEFSYRKSTSGLVNTYTLTWETGSGAGEYKYISVTAYGNVIVSYDTYDSDRWSYSGEAKLAQLSGDELYEKATEYINTLNPVIAKYISIDRDSLSMSLYGNTASFKLTRTKDGIPVSSDGGRIYLNKNTGALYSMYVNWHPKASFRAAEGIISEEEAMQSYGEMMDISPIYVLEYDEDTDKYVTSIMYRQNVYGSINAFTGAVSDFEEDGYYADDVSNGSIEEDAALETGGAGFTQQELAELEKELPYGNSQAVIKLVQSNEYLTWADGLSVSYDSLYKDTFCNADRYIYSVTFDNESYSVDYAVEEDIVEETDSASVSSSSVTAAFVTSEEGAYKSVSVTVDAETGEILSYSYSDSESPLVAEDYDLDKAQELADKAIKSLSPTHYGEFTQDSAYAVTRTISSAKATTGSRHTYKRTANGIDADFNGISVRLDAQMNITYYSIEYYDIDFVSPKGILSEEEALEKFWEQADIELEYQLKTDKVKTLSVLVYTADKNLYSDAFTGELYGGTSSEENDLSALTDGDILAKAEKMSENGILICGNAFTESDAISYEDFSRLIGVIGGSADDTAKSDTVTRAQAIKAYVTAVCGSKAAELKGIFKSPFGDVSNDSPLVGYAAIAYALGAVSGTQFNAAALYTYGEMINLVYDTIK